MLGIATIPRPNRPPVATNDAYNAREDITLTRPAPGVLANDADADGDRLTASIIRRPGRGTLDLDPKGSFTYRPKRNFNGKVTFIYQARDGKGGADSATVAIKVRAQPD